MEYLEGVKGYKLCYLEEKNKRCLISKDMVFNKNEFSRLKAKSKPSVEKLGDISQFEIEVESHQIRSRNEPRERHVEETKFQAERVVDSSKESVQQGIKFEEL